MKSWGGPVMNRAMPAPGEFNTPHSIAADAQGNIYVADRGNRRIQVFDHDGNFKKIITIDVPVPPDAKSWFSNARTPKPTWRNAGAPWAICITPGPGTQYLYSADAYPGRVYKLSLDGKVLGCSAGPAASPSSSAGFTKWRVPRRTSCTSPRS